MPAPLLIAGLAAGAAGLNYLGGRKANQDRAKEAQKDRDFQERMSSSSWQRGKADMEAAGINPALAYQKGGASSPSGAMAGQEDELEGSVSSAMAVKRMDAELKIMKEQEQEIYNRAQLHRNQAEESAYRRELIVLQQDRETIMNTQLELQLPWLRAQSAAAEKVGGIAAMTQLLMQSGGGQALSLAGTLGGARLLRGASGTSGIGGRFRPQRVRFQLPAVTGGR